MIRTTLAVILLFSLAAPLPLLAEEQSVAENTAETVASDSEAASSVDTATSRPMRGMGMMHRGKGQHGMKHGGGQHGKGHGGMKHGGGQHGKGQGGMKHGDGHSEKHRQVVRRLDMIEARMAKIEAMLEILMRR